MESSIDFGTPSLPEWLRLTRSSGESSYSPSMQITQLHKSTVPNSPLKQMTKRLRNQKCKLSTTLHRNSINRPVTEAAQC